MLLKSGAKINHYDGRASPLHAAIEVLKCPEVVQFLVDRGADINLLARGDGWTPLHLACHVGNVEAATVLLHKGASVNAKTWKEGLKPIDLAQRAGRTDIVKLLKGPLPPLKDTKPEPQPAIQKAFISISCSSTKVNPPLRIGTRGRRRST